MARSRAGARGLLVTCEHGGRRVPRDWRHLFAAHRALLDTHRAWDPGSLVMARELAAFLGAPLVASTTTRLLVDLNRSLHHPRLFSEVTRALPRDVRTRLVALHWRPYREAVERRVAAMVARGRPVLHVSAHSFTPELDGRARDADVGLLYDPGRKPERAFAARWRNALRAIDPGLRVRMNYPYAGRADGLTTHLRRLFPPAAYAGIELEINQRHVIAGGRDWSRLRRSVLAAAGIALR